MINEPIYTTKVGKVMVGIYMDYTGVAESPLEHDDSIIMAVLHNRYINPAEKDGLTSPEAIKNFAEENKGVWEEFPLYLYDHGNTIYRIEEHGKNPFSCPWDSGRVGSLFVKIKEFSCPEAAAIAICTEYTAWANGEIYGYIAETPNGEEDSCWGFVGDYDYCLKEATNAAECLNSWYLETEARRLEDERPDLYGVAS